VLSPYECGTEPNCPSCSLGQICSGHSCYLWAIDVPETAQVGDDVTVRVTENGMPCNGCGLSVTLPDGSVVSGNADENGVFVFGVENAGEYIFKLEKGEGAIKALVTVTEKAQPVSEAGFPWFWTITGLLVLLLLILLLFWWRRKKKPRK